MLARERKSMKDERHRDCDLSHLGAAGLLFIAMLMIVLSPRRRLSGSRPADGRAAVGRGRASCVTASMVASTARHVAPSMLDVSPTPNHLDADAMRRRKPCARRACGRDVSARSSPWSIPAQVPVTVNTTPVAPAARRRAADGVRGVGSVRRAAASTATTPSSEGSHQPKCRSRWKQSPRRSVSDWLTCCRP